MYARNAQLVSPTSRKKCMLLTENGVGQLIQGLQREREENKCTGGAHRLCVRWDCHKISITWKPSLKYLFFPEFWQEVERGRVLEL